jgi:RNA polymerase sigma-70 factor (ECF subfamily)
LNRPSPNSDSPKRTTELDEQHVLDLLRQVAKRDEAAFDQLYRALSRRVYAFAFHALRDAPGAAEVVSETLYEVWKAPGDFRGEGKLSTWVLGIARYKILDRMRARQPLHEDVDAMADTLASDEPDAFDVLALQQRREGVQACLDKLPAVQRECLYLVYYEGLSLAEVSTMQSVPESTVKTRLFHARIKIKQCLKSVLRREGVE